MKKFLQFLGISVVLAISLYVEQRWFTGFSAIVGLSLLVCLGFLSEKFLDRWVAVGFFYCLLSVQYLIKPSVYER